MDVGQPAIEERLERIEEQLRLLSAHAGIPYAQLDVPSEVVELARRDERIRASLKLTEMTGMEFVEAQRIVSRL
jgi:hypothetical protein